MRSTVEKRETLHRPMKEWRYSIQGTESLSKTYEGVACGHAGVRQKIDKFSVGTPIC